MSTVAVFHYPADASLAGLGLSAEPFPPGPGDGYFFATPALSRSIERVRDLVRAGDAPIVLTGPTGIGKTCLLDELTIGSAGDWRVCRVQGAPDTTPGLLVEELMAALALAPASADAGARLDILLAHLQTPARDGQLVLIAVDDADRLPQETCSLIARLAARPGQPGARVLLTCEPASVGLARGPVPDADAGHLIELAPLSLEQTEAYLNARLRHAGFSAESPFSADAIRHIHDSAGGVPGAMHALASQALASRARGGLGAGAGRGRALRVVLGLVLAGAVTGLLLSRLSGSLDGGSAGPQTASGGAAGKSGGATSTARSAPARRDGGQAKPTHDDIPAAAHGARVDVATSSSDGEPAVKVYPLAPPSSTVAVAATPEAAATPETTAAPVAAAPAPETALADNVTIGALLHDDSATASASALMPAGLHDLAWLQAQDDSSYVIQLLGTREPDALEKFARDNGLGARAAWFATTHQGGPWYVLVYGLYPDRGSARTAAAALPEKLRARVPWARSVADIKALAAADAGAAER